MKKYLAIVALMLTCLTTHAQVTWNIKAGFGLSQAVGLNSEGNSKPKFVFKGGVGAEIPFKKNLMLMPSLEYANKGAKWEHKEAGLEAEINMHYLQIPVLLAYRIPIKASNLTFKAGPYFAYAMSGYLTYKSIDPETIIEGSNKIDLFKKDAGGKRFDVGVDAGIDLEYHSFVIGVEYERGFSKMVDAGSHVNNSAFYMTLGYKF